MLQRVADTESDALALQVGQFEQFAESFISLLCGRHVSCVLSDEEREISLDRDWTRFRSASGQQFGVAIQEQANDPHPDLHEDFRRLLGWADLIKKNYSVVFASAPPIILPPSDLSDWGECEVQVLGVDGSRFIGAIAAPGAVLETRWDRSLVERTPSPSCLQRTPRREGVRLFLQEVMHIGQGEVRASSLMYLAVSQRCFLARLEQSLTSRSYYVICLLQEVRMEEAAGVPVTLDLGDIELSAAQLLTLRPGMHLAYERPVTFEATLRIAGTPWAVADLRIDERQVHLTLTELVQSPNSPRP